MNDWFDASMKLQKQMIDAQQAALGTGEALAKMQEAGRDIAEANMEAMKAWTKLWSVWL